VSHIGAEYSKDTLGKSTVWLICIGLSGRRQVEQPYTIPGLCGLRMTCACMPICFHGLVQPLQQFNELVPVEDYAGIELAAR
jgi:hypothetical protein